LNRRPWPIEEPDQPVFNLWMDRLSAPGASLFGVSRPPYFAFGVVGLAAGFTTLLFLGLRSGEPVAFLWALAVATVVVFLAAGLVRKAILRVERHVLLPDTLLVLASAGLVAAAIGRPVLHTLDLVAVAVGAFLVFGRLGCLAGGCCHGRPAPLGIRYSEEIVGPLAGLRLFPVQLVESVFTLALTGGAAALLLDGPPGAALWFWLLGYGAGRFVLELARGDRARGAFGPLTSAQGLALLLLAARLCWEQRAASWSREALAGGLATVVALGAFLSRRIWLLQTPPVLRPSDVAPWSDFLAALEEAAASSPAGDATPAVRQAPAPWSRLRVAHLALPGRDRQWLLSYTLQDPEGRLEADAAFFLLGFVAQRLPHHQVLLCGVEPDRVHLHVALLDRAGTPGSTLADAPELVLERARAFASALRRHRASAPADAADAAEAPEAPEAPEQERPTPETPPEPRPETERPHYFRAHPRR